MLCDLLAQGDESILGESPFHPVDLLVDPLDIPRNVPLGGVDPVERCGAFPSDSKGDRKSCQSTFFLLVQEQPPEMLFRHFDGETAYLRILHQFVIKSPRELPDSREGRQGDAPAVVTIIPSKETNKHLRQVAAIAPTSGHPPVPPFRFPEETFDYEFVVTIPDTVTDVPIMGTVPTSGGLSPTDTGGKDIIDMAAITLDPDSWVSPTSRVEMVGEKLNDLHMPRTAAHRNTRNSFRHLKGFPFMVYASCCYHSTVRF